MTLTAISSDHQFFNPSALIEAGEDELDVVDRMRARHRAKELYCPHRYRRTGEMVPVGFRNPNERRKHFFHLDALGDSSECHNYSRESEDHMEAKMTIKESLSRRNPFATVEVEKLLQEGETKRTPDVLVVYKNGAREAHEIQFSAINIDGLKPRTEDLKAMGCTVVWYLAAKNWTKENRGYLRSNGIQYFKLYRHDGQFKWKPDEGDEKQHTRSSGERTDNCGRRFTPRSEPRRPEQREPPPVVNLEVYKTRESEKVLYEWFLSIAEAPIDTWPIHIEPPFELKVGQTVKDLDRWLAVTRQEVYCNYPDVFNTSNPKKPSPRHRTGALQADIRTFQKLILGKSEESHD